MYVRDLRLTECNPSSSVVHRRFILVVRSRGVLSFDLVLRRDQCWAQSCTSSTQPMFRNLLNRSVLKSFYNADDTQFHNSCKSTDAAELAARTIRVIEAVRDYRCRQTGSD